MKLKDIIAIIFSAVVIGGSVFYAMRVLNPPAPKPAVTKEAETIIEVPEKLDDKFLEELSKKTDFGEPKLDNLGKEDLFR